MGDVIDITERLARKKQGTLPNKLAVRGLKNLYVTANCEDYLHDYFGDKEDAREFMLNCMMRFIRNDFGTLGQEDIEGNWHSMENGGTVTGCYPFDERQFLGEEAIEDTSELQMWVVLDSDGQTLTMLVEEDC